MKQTTTLYLTLKQPFTVKDLHSILTIVLSSQFGNMEAQLMRDNMVVVKGSGAVSTKWIDLSDELMKHPLLLRTTLNLNFNGSPDVDATSAIL